MGQATDFIPWPEGIMSHMSWETYELCESTCKASSDCIYYYFDDRGSPLQKCHHRLTGTAAATFNASFDPTSAAGRPVQNQVIYLEISEGLYATYQGVQRDYVVLAEAGINLSDYSTHSAADEACKALAACVGFVFDSTKAPSPFRTFRATLQTGVTGKVRVTGPSLYPCIFPPGMTGPCTVRPQVSQTIMD